MPIWFTTADRTKVNWGTDLTDGVAQVDLFHIQRPADNSYELVFLFARAGQTLLGQKITWAQGVESGDAVPAPLTPPASEGGSGGASGGGYAPDPSSQPDNKWLTTASGAYVFTDGPTGGGVPIFTATHAVGVGTLRWFNDTGSTITISGLRVSLSADAVDAATVVDVNVDGVSALDAPVQVTVGSSTSGKTTDEIIVPDGSFLTVDVDSVGTPGVGETVAVQFFT